jgi:hypothetical protein
MIQLELVVRFNVVDTLYHFQVSCLNLFAQEVLEVIDSV